MKEIRLCWIKVADLKAGCNVEENEDTSDDWHQALLKSIKERGIIEPLLVINFPNRYHVKVGNSRLWAANKLGIKNAKCIVVTLERHLGKSKMPDGKEVNNVKDLFVNPTIWIERENYVAMKNTHIHMGHEKVY